jgi:hypothetical protein
MRYAQIKGGQRLHLVYEGGEGRDDQHLVRNGFLSQPLCGAKSEGYRMTINVPLGNACRNCMRVYRARQGSIEG